jgi:hypothetical protein
VKPEGNVVIIIESYAYTARNAAQQVTATAKAVSSSSCRFEPHKGLSLREINERDKV